jgi:hypothetical protein
MPKGTLVKQSRYTVMFGCLCKTLHDNIPFSYPLSDRTAAFNQINVLHNALKNKDKHVLQGILTLLGANLTLANQLHHITLIRLPLLSLAI